MSRRESLKRLWAFVAVLGLALGLRPAVSFAGGPASAVHKDASLRLARSERTLGFTALASRLADTQTLRVIVRLNTGFSPEAGLSMLQQRDQQDDISKTAQSLKRELANATGTAVDDFESLEHLPYAIVTVDAEGLRVLQNSWLVAGIQEDVADPVALAESGVQIGASGALGVHALGYTGTGYAVAILDTGVERDHPFFGGRVIAEACFSSTYSMPDSTSVCPNGTNEQYGIDAARPCDVAMSDPMGSCEHGTHVAGIAAGGSYAGMASDGASAVYDGVAPGADIIAVQVFSRFNSTTNCGSPANTPCYLSYSSDQLRGLNWLAGVVGTYNLVSVNMSLGGTIKSTSACDSDSRKSGIDNLRAAGVATFIASGNAYFTDGLSYPACISTAISVGSVYDGSLGATPIDTVSSFSNSSALLSMLAPGQWIQSSVPDGGYGIMSGTSMAAPHAAGAWAVMREMYPADTLDQLLARLLGNGVSVTDGRNSIVKPRLRLVEPPATETPTPTPSPTASNTPLPTHTPTATTIGAPTTTETLTATPSATGSPIPTALSSSTPATATATIALPGPALDYRVFLPALEH